MICEDVRAALGAGDVCEESEAGARVVTHCLYPSFEPVTVYVTKLGEGYRVSDHGGAARCAWIHGKNETLSVQALNREAARHSLRVSGQSLIADVPSIDWLRAGILATANASASVAHTAIGKATAAAESHLREIIFAALSSVAKPECIGSDVEVTGTSGDSRHFDYSWNIANDNRVLINAVSPHHASIAAKYVSFADTRAIVGTHGLAVYEQRLETGDVSLMMQVAELVPVTSLALKAKRLAVS